MRRHLNVICFLLGIVWASNSQALHAASFEPVFIGSGWTITLERDIRSAFDEAASRYLEIIESAPSAVITIEMRLDNPPNGRVFGHSMTNVELKKVGLTSIRREGAVHELITGEDPNGTAPDGRMVWDLSWITENVWFGADFSNLPAGKLDGYSYLLHELGHILGFNFVTSPDGSHQSHFDSYLQTKNGVQYFTGPAAVLSNHGKWISITTGNPSHFGNPGDPSEITKDLMNGISFEKSVRYEISAIDVAVFKDLGLIQ